MKALLFISLLCACSCTYMDKTRVIAAGGRGAYSGREFSGTWDNVENMNNALATAGLLGGAYIQAGVSKAKEITSQKANANATKRVINKDNLDAATEQLGITTSGGIENAKILKQP